MATHNDEIREELIAKGFSGEQLESVLEIISRNVSSLPLSRSKESTYGMTVRSDGIVRILHSTLVDKYKDDFCIFQELLQNADDARAENVLVGISNGLSKAHPLADVPALFFFNDGPVTDKNLYAIQSVASSDKNDDEHKIGKFGLGMKSIFHIAEAFFCFGGGENSFSPRLVTPWQEDVYPQWKQKWDEEADNLATLIEKNLPTQVLEWKRWFCVWIPLREKDDDNQATQPIIEEYPKASDFMSTAYFERSSTLLPMLKNVKTLSFVESGVCSHSLKVLADKRITGESDGNYMGQATANSKLAFEFIGQEYINADDEFQQLIQSDLWPKQLTSAYGENNDKTSVVRDKNQPHTAICIIKIPAKENKAELVLNQCVFLPLTEESYREAIRNGQYTYILDLHGCYFVDAGRQGLEIRNIGIDYITKEQELTACWNHILQKKGVFPHLIPMLVYCMEKWSEQDIDEIMKSLKGIDFISKNLPSICIEQIFVKVLCNTGCHWKALPRTAKVFEMAIPATGKLLDYLASSTEYAIIDSSASSLRYPRTQNNSDLSHFISFVFQGLNSLPVEEIFTQENHDFLVDFFAMVGKNRHFEEPFAFWKRIISDSRIENYSSFMSEHSLYMMETPDLFAFIDETSSIDKSKQNISIWKYLTDDTTERILILQDKDVTISNIGSNEDIPEGDYQSILYRLQHLSEDDLRSPIAKKLLRTCFSQVYIDKMPDGIITYPYWEIEGNKYSTVQLRNMATDNQLCTGTSSLINTFLQAVKWKLLPISRDLIKPLELDINDFSEETAIEILEKCPELHEAEMRIGLLNILLQSDDFKEDRKRACRYLLHGKPQLYDFDGDLLSPLNGDFFAFSQKIVEIITESECPVAYSLPEELLRKLDFYRDKLGILSKTPNSLIRKLASMKSRINFMAFPDDSWEYLLRMADFSETDLIEIIKSIPIFHTTDDELTDLDDSCYLVGNVSVPNILKEDVRCIKQSGDKVVSERLNKLVYFWSNKTALRYCTRHSYTNEMDEIILRGLKSYYQDRLPGQVYQYLNGVPWVLLKDGRRISPNRLNILLSFKELPSNIQGEYAHCDDVRSDEIKNILGHFNLHLNQEDSLSVIFRLMRSSDDYNIGRLGLLREHINFTCQLLCNVFSKVEDMPIVTMIASLRDEGVKVEVIDNQIKYFQRSIPAERLVRVINSLSSLESDLGKAKNEFNYPYWFLQNYLDEAVDYPDFLQSIVSNIYLYNERGKLKSCKELCFDAYNVRSEYQLNGDYSTHGRFWKHLCGRKPQGKLNGKETLQTLQAYFEDWDAALEGRFAERIAGFMICCTDDPKVISFVKSNLGFQYRDIEETRNELHPDLNRLVADKRVIIQSNTSKDVDVIALDGSHFTAPLNSIGESKDLFVGNGGACGFVSDNQALHLRTFKNSSSPEIMENIAPGSLYLHLRKPTKEELKTLDETKLDSMLKETLVFILRELNINPGNIDTFWDSVSHGEQLDINVTRNILLQHAPMYLRILRCRQPSVDAIFKELHAEEYVREEASRNKNKQRILQSQEKTDRLLKQLCDLIKDEESDVSKCILEALQHQIRNTYNYSEQSILFELFQNADDASEELRSLYGNRQPEYRDQFVVKYDGERLIVVNWGRMINQIRVPGIETKQDVSGFQRDLEKMILLSQSDKEQENLNVVGKFGLGFKSVFLVSERPVILSGRLRFCIEGGFLPQTLSDDEIASYDDILKEYCEHTEVHPTILILPVIHQKRELVTQAISGFSRQVNLLALFSKRIKQISIISEQTKVDYSLPQEFKKEALCNAFEGQYWVFKMQDAQLLFGSKNGFIYPLPDEVATFWATAPTSIRLGLGIAINGNFDLDTGRSVMNMSSNNNSELVRRISISLFDLLSRLWRELEERVKTKGDPGNVFKVNFMTYLWNVFINSHNTSKWFSEQQDKSINILREIIWNSQCAGGYSKFVTLYPVIPSCLPGRFSQLCDLKNITRSMTDEMISSELWQLVDDNTIIPGTIVADTDIAKPLMKFLKLSRTIDIYGVEALLSSLLQRFPCLTPSWLKGHSGHVLLEGLRKLDIEKLQQLEKERYRNLLAQFHFESIGGRSCLAKDLLIAGTDNSDESLKASFAPKDNVLNSLYDETGIGVFRLIRVEVQISPEKLARWAVSASGKQEQSGVLNYVLKAENTKTFCEKIIEFKAKTWIELLHKNEIFKALPQEQRLIIIGKFKLNPKDFGIYDSSEAQEDLGVLLPSNYINEKDPQFFQKVYDYWCENHEKGSRSYNRLLYNREDVAPLTFDTDTLEQRSQWMEVLLLGACHTLGLKLGQHSGFIKFLKEKGYWSVYCKPGEINPDEWLDTLDRFLDAEELNNGEYAHWMKLFMRIFQFAKYLDDYIEIFSWWDNPGNTPHSRYELTSVRGNSRFSGTGITPPGLNKALGSGKATGLHFVFREMVRRKAITRNDKIFRYCFVPYKDISETADAKRDSEDIYWKVVTAIGVDKATFLNDFDIAILKYGSVF